MEPTAFCVHIALGVSDLDRAERFYRVFLDAEPVKRRAGYAKFVVRPPGLNLALTERPGATRSDAHFGIQVASTEDVEAAVRRLSEAGLAAFPERDTDCCYALQDKVWVHDPDGNAWEVFVVKADTGEEAGAAAGARPCC